MNINLEKVKTFYYKDGLSTKEVGEKLNISVWQVIRFMKKNQLLRRPTNETQNLQFLRKEPSFKRKSSLKTKEKELKTAGLMLYWGEGVKTSDDTVDLANSDSEMIKIFLKMLREIYGVKQKRLRILLYCYANQNIKKLINYWVKITKIPKDQFSKPYIRQDFLEKKINKMPYGLVHVRYCDKKLVTLIKQETKKLIKKFNSQGSEVDNRTSL